MKGKNEGKNEKKKIDQVSEHEKKKKGRKTERIKEGRRKKNEGNTCE
jgi:hypothetical protein